MEIEFPVGMGNWESRGNEINMNVVLGVGKRKRNNVGLSENESDVYSLVGINSHSLCNVAESGVLFY